MGQSQEIRLLKVSRTPTLSPKKQFRPFISFWGFRNRLLYLANVPKEIKGRNFMVWYAQRRNPLLHDKQIIVFLSALNK